MTSELKQSANEALQELALLETIACGGEAGRRALKDLYFQYAHRFRGYFLRRGLNQADAEDLTQESFIKIVRSAANANSITAPRAWLWSVAKSVLLDHLKKTPSSNQEWDAQGDEPFSEFSHDQQAMARCVEQQFQQFASSSPEGAQIIRWVVLDGFSSTEVAEMIDRTHGATREYLSQLRKKLRPLLEVCRDLLHTR
ncbi:RNA polymerase sigma factor [Spongiibacter sp. KMU-158]|uniref:RNA polymerase sigma factor n=1 Tax=Spongiibacter pelagi TaxID=2760804 RepID=A0A927C4E9_9GAMM|nr:RNA polymerase sigma factor [Spongiibacter pelagi]MBD2859240.1 RNA polymerase sigma factor [Spongiibacter pelagi]